VKKVVKTGKEVTQESKEDKDSTQVNTKVGVNLKDKGNRGGL